MSEKIINKIRNLFRHAESAEQIGSQAEAEAFAARAHKLLLDYKLSMEDVDRATLDLEDPMEERDVESEEWGSPNRSRRERRSEQLAKVVAKSHFCTTACSPRSNALHFFGRKSDVEIAIFMFTYLARIAARLSREELRRVKSNYRKVQPRSTRRGVTQRKARWKHRINNTLWPGDPRFLDSFHEGFCLAIFARYLMQRDEADAESGHALVLRRSDADAEAFADTVCRIARGLKRQRPHEQALGLGWTHGNEVNIDLKGLRSTSKPVGQLESAEEGTT